MEKFYKFFIFALLLSCATKSVEIRKNNQIIPLSGQPLWLNLNHFENNEFIFFTQKEVSDNKFSGLRKAKDKLIEDMKTYVAEKIKIQYNEKLEKIKSYKKIGEELREEFCSKTMELLDFENLIPDDIYTEKKLENKEFYVCYVFKRVSKRDIKDREVKAIEFLKNKFQNNKEYSDFLKEILKQY